MMPAFVRRNPFHGLNHSGPEKDRDNRLSLNDTDNRFVPSRLPIKDSNLSKSPDSLRSLIVRCNRGEKLAWEEFYRKYAGLVRRAVSRLGGGNPNEIEDLVQDVFVQLFSALRTYDQTRPIETYIVEIARRVRISKYRKNSAAKRGGSVRVTVPLDAHDGGEAGFITIPAMEDDQEAVLIRAQQTGLLRTALKGLSETCRKLLAMRYDRGLSYKEMAIAVEAREVTLRVRVQRCLSSLARSYTELAVEEGGNL